MLALIYFLFYEVKIYGEMAEWSNAVDSKSIVRVSVPGVQIPLSPPVAALPATI